MDNTDKQGVELQDLTVSTVLENIAGEKKTYTLYGYCPGCKTIHGDNHRLAEYLQFLTEFSLFNWN